MNCVKVSWQGSPGSKWVESDVIWSKSHLIETIGWLVSEDEETLILALNHDFTTGLYFNKFYISKSSILRVQKISFPGGKIKQKKPKVRT